MDNLNIKIVQDINLKTPNVKITAKEKNQIRIDKKLSKLKIIAQ